MGTVAYPQIVLLGDSISALSFKKGGYGADIVSRYAAKADVVNRGMPGYTSLQVLRVLQGHETTLHPHSPRVKLWIVHVGTNDAVSEGYHKIPLEEFECHLKEIIIILRKYHPDARLILLTPAMSDPEAWHMWQKELGATDDMLLPRDNEHVKLYAETTIKVCDELAVLSINCFEAFEKAVEGGVSLAELLYDGLHYTPIGYQIISDKLIPLIQNEISDMSPSVMISPFTYAGIFGYEGNLMAATYQRKLQSALGDDKDAAVKFGFKLEEKTKNALIARGYGPQMLP